ncbi:MAG: sigma-54 dependent transcriptional regulator [Bdellovibrionota bacterium]
MQKPQLLLVDDQKIVCDAISLHLEGFYDLRVAHSYDSALRALNELTPQLCIVDYHLGDDRYNGLSLAQEFHDRQNNVPIILLTADRTPSLISKALSIGISDFITKPFEVCDLKNCIEKNLFLNSEIISYNENRENTPSRFIGRSYSAQKVRIQAEKVAKTNINTMILGESGTGKEVLAREIHRLRKQKLRPFVTINCAAIPKELMESIIFGHEKGAFSGATESRKGKFEIADNGDIFLDEIGSLSLELQGKLLRVLQEKEFERIGSNQIIKSQFRVICANNQDLWSQVIDGKFREDLYYRLSPIQIEIPPLRERREDIPQLIEYYLRSPEKNPDQRKISPQAVAALTQKPWRGNARQLFNALDSMIVFSEGRIIESSDIPENIDRSPVVIDQQENTPSRERLSNFQDKINQLETTYIQTALKFSQETNKSRRFFTDIQIGIA